MQTLLQDLRYSVRMLWKKPGFTLIAVLTLALGIGATTAIFSVVNAYLLRPLPYQEPERLLMLQPRPTTANYGAVYSYPVFHDVQAQNQSFDGVAAFANRRLTFDGGGEPEMVFGARVTRDFFSVLGVAPLVGRAFAAGDDAPEQPTLVLLSYGLWQRRFGGDPNIVGQSVTAEKETVTIAGVMPPQLKFDLMPEFPKVEFWTLLKPSPRLLASYGVREFRILARLKPTATVAQARAELDAIAQRIKQTVAVPVAPGADELALSAIALKEFFVGDAQKPLWVLLGAVGFVLLIACVNVANLLLAHGVGRQKELAIRAVLGADRRRLMRQMLTESLLLALAGGVLGWLFVTWALELIVWLTPKWMVRMEAIRLDSKVFFFTLAVSVFTGLLFGLLPALQASKVDLHATLKAAGTTFSGAGRGFRSLLVIAEVALAVVLLVGAGLLLNSFVRLTHVDIGFNSEQVLTMYLRMLSRSEAPEQNAFAQEALPRVQALPGVQSAAFVEALPVGGGNSQTNKRSRLLEGPVSGNADASLTIAPRSATPGYFQTLGLKLIKGRLFTDADTAATEPVVVVSERLAQQAWPGEDPLGKRFLWSWQKEQRPVVIGVVADVREYNQEPEPLLYMPFHQNPSSYSALVVRTATPPASLTAAVRQQLTAVDRRVILEEVMTLEQRLSESVAQPRFYAVLLGWFGVMGLLLAVLGLYGVLSYTVNQMTREVGIRMALGAQRGDVLKLIVGHGLVLTGIGLLVGLAGAAGLTRLLASLLFNVTTTDPITYLAVAFVLLVTALLACWLPAWRAAKVDPMIALRCE